MSLDKQQQHELRRLISRLCDDALPDDEWQRLAAWLERDSAALALYMQYLEVHTSLAWSQSPWASAPPQPSAQPAGSGMAARSLRRLARAARFLARPTPFSWSVAALVVGLLVTAMAFIAPPVYRTLTRQVLPEDADRYRIVAELTGLDGAQWADGADVYQRGAFLSKGRRIALASGAVTVTYRSGAKVTLAGPGELLVDDANGGTLSAGQLVASVPPSAAGYTIDTTALSIVDLGTEFAVQVAPDNSVTVDVLAGRVLAKPTLGAARDALELTAGRSLRYDGAWHIAASDTSRHAHWRRLARRTAVETIDGVRVVDCSSQLDDGHFQRRADSLVDGSGLVRGGHTTLPDASTGAPRSMMWLTHGTIALPHDPLPAHVTFDLGAAYELTGLHVWNYNEAVRGLVSRGAREVEISVSPTASVEQLVPLTTAQGNFSFPSATGRADDSGFAVVFGEGANATALARVRLVRLTILSNHGPNALDESDHFAGLSEVRFMGRSL